MARTGTTFVLAAIVCAAGFVAWVSWPKPLPRAYAGLEFAAMTPAASARTPLLEQGGALIQSVDKDSPAARAGILTGEVVAALDGKKVASAAGAARILRDAAPGSRMTLTLYNIIRGDIRPHQKTLVFDAARPVEPKRFTVLPPRLLAKKHFAQSGWAAGSAYARRISHGASARPMELPLLAQGQCSALAPDDWQVVESGARLFHAMSEEGDMHAVFKQVELNPGITPNGFVVSLLRDIFHAPVTTAPPQARPLGFTAVSFGNDKDVTGLALWRMDGKTLSVWVAGVPASEAGNALPLTSAVMFSVDCGGATAPRDPALLATRISSRCSQGKCGPSDFAASYLSRFRLGYVHAADGSAFLVNTRQDFWANGDAGPGYYRQISGMAEKLTPGRTN